MPHTGKPLVELPKVEPTSTARHVSDVTSEEKYMTNKSELGNPKAWIEPVMPKNISVPISRCKKPPQPKQAQCFIQSQASAFKLSATIYKPIKDNAQAITSFALRDKIASNLIKSGET